ncbi:DsbE family thiol:disulfide interchange protein [Photobacterium sanctipauli]|uniref:DsbE family thiol:disulfide interchange protein n=1 Tax=Photobacterium sanctipauli TaxID=1342794 RepID=A0A2T3NNR2_9GAMM|nr:DsbE family thiol:disulfide interchange protein [Photobacterium sanctipauli]PSW17599.1 DsbE family thiol:disulfide interchange protein [Photobacterium sanctipauli]
MKKVTRFIPLIAVIAVIGIIAVSMSNDQPSSLARVEKTPIPQFQVPTFSPTAVLASESMFKDRLTLLNVWASWCAVCQSEHPFLMSLAESKRIDIVGLNYRDSMIDARGILQRTGNPYHTVLYDPKGQLALDLGVYGTPESYLVDQQGNIRYRYSGALDEQIWQEQFEPVIQLIKEQQDASVSG